MKRCWDKRQSLNQWPSSSRSYEVQTAGMVWKPFLARRIKSVDSVILFLNLCIPKDFLMKERDRERVSSLDWNAIWQFITFLINLARLMSSCHHNKWYVYFCCWLKTFVKLMASRKIVSQFRFPPFQCDSSLRCQQKDWRI